MADMKQIHDFAVKWCDKFRDQNINYIDLVDHFMADDCAPCLGLQFILNGDISTIGRMTQQKYWIPKTERGLFWR